MTDPIAWHITARLSLDRLLATSPLEYRSLARVVRDNATPRTGFDPGLVAYSMPDSHLHLLVRCDRRTAGRFVRCLESALCRRMPLPVGFERARFTPVNTQRHLCYAFDYILRQHERHESQSDPYREATSLPDLLGLRLSSAFVANNANRCMPRLDPSHLVKHLGHPLRQGTNPEVLVASACAVMLIDSLQGNRPDAVLARRLAVHWGAEQGLKHVDIASCLGLSPRSVRRSLRRQVDPSLTTAVGLQVGLREVNNP
jgi:hypothetical protein